MHIVYLCPPPQLAEHVLYPCHCQPVVRPVQGDEQRLVFQALLLPGPQISFEIELCSIGQVGLSLLSMIEVSLKRGGRYGREDTGEDSQ